ncbi:hypothetical protein LTR49_027632, partial [Elasticomyces elasticus]
PNVRDLSDNRKQSYDDLRRSLISQPGCEEPALSTLFEAHQQSSQDTLSPRYLDRMLTTCIESYDRVTLMLDAVDECPEGEVRESVFEHLEQLSAEYTNIKFLTISRELVQLRELKNLKSFKPSRIEATLRSLPATLDKMYDRMLLSIEKDVRGEALVLIRWLAYAQSPPSLGELVEAIIIDLTGNGIVNFADRGDLEDSLEILSGFVTIVATDDDYGDSDDYQSSVGDLDNGGPNEEDPSNGDLALTTQDLEKFDMVSDQQYRFEAVVRLAHFSVKEYLESSRILDSDAKVFYLDRQLPFRGIEDEGSGLYYASFVGLEAAVPTLIERGADVNARGGDHGNALQAASKRGHKKVVAMLLDRGAEAT